MHESQCIIVELESYFSPIAGKAMEKIFVKNSLRREMFKMSQLIDDHRVLSVSFHSLLNGSFSLIRHVVSYL